VAITSDGSAPRATFDLFQAMRKCQLMEHLHYDDPFYLPAGKLLEMVTIDAARALGWDDEIGSLEVGKRADMILVNLQQPHLVPELMPVHRLVYECSGADVETVIVAGRIVMENHQVQTVNELEILQAAQEESLATIQRAGIRDHLNPPAWGQVYQRFERVIGLPFEPGAEAVQKETGGY
jgi:5-methylthioadenosine/S-adenosylhomocysteine deaminase